MKDKDIKEYVGEKVEESSEDLKAYADQKIQESVKNLEKRDFRKQAALLIIAAILSAIVSFSMAEYTREKNANITTAYKVNNNSVTFTLHNSARVAASEIKIIGDINGQEKVITVVRDKILSNKEDVKIDVPFKVVNVTGATELIKSSPREGAVGEFSLPAGIAHRDNHLLYRIECDTCNNKNTEWRLIRPTHIGYYIVMQNLGGKLYTTPILSKPQWAAQ